MDKTLVATGLILAAACAALLPACAGSPASTATPAASPPATRVFDDHGPLSDAPPPRAPIIDLSKMSPAATATSPTWLMPIVYQPLPGHKPVIYLVSDSTVKNGNDTGSTMGEWGWGHLLHYYFDETQVTVENDAVGGTSSRSFFETPSMWPRTLGKMQQGDYVFIQFGANDDTRPPQSDTLRYRSTIKSNGEETVQGPKDANTMETIHSFGWYERQMIAQARAKNAIPVVCSLIPRNSWSATGKANRADPGYASLAHQAADQAGAFFLPLNALIAAEYDKLGRAKVTADLFPPGESTHTTWAGAKLNAQCVAQGVKALEGCPLKEFLKDKPDAPDTPDMQPGGRAAPRPTPAPAARPG